MVLNLVTRWNDSVMMVYKHTQTLCTCVFVCVYVMNDDDDEGDVQAVESGDNVAILLKIL